MAERCRPRRGCGCLQLSTKSWELQPVSRWRRDRRVRQRPERRDRRARPRHECPGHRLEQIDRQIAELADLWKDLSALLEQWTERLAATPPGRQARLLDMLTDRPSLTPPKGSRRRFGRASQDSL